MGELKTNCNNKCPFYNNYTCLKPNGFVCTSVSITVSNYDYKELKSTIAKRCAICENCIEINSGEIICDECKEAIKKFKEMLKNDK